ncbi:unnamed protein product [Aphis gossypii]|uniref:Uncharacterized protein n=1 Tax=Aphis gossypii TaxID=80765 RepID=A0A9P0NNM7_APHGO|nr:unnamed protein product [Aphis gossypii]
MKYRLWNKTVKYFQQYSLPCKTCRDLSLHKVRDSIKWYVCVNVFFFKSRPPNDSRRVSTDRSILYISKATDEEKLLTTAACDSMTPQLRVFINFYHRKKMIDLKSLVFYHCGFVAYHSIVKLSLLAHIECQHYLTSV